MNKDYQYITDMISQNDVVLFMKGTPEKPYCGFSYFVSSLLMSKDISFKSFNILKDANLRADLKIFSNWPTFPQLYYKNELVGGHDIIKTLEESGELDKILST